MISTVNIICQHNLSRSYSQHLFANRFKSALLMRHGFFLTHLTHPFCCCNQMCVQLACTHLTSAELGEMAARLADEFVAMAAKRPGSVAGGSVAQVGAILPDAGGSYEDMQHDASLVDTRIAHCLNRLQHLCRFLPCPHLYNTAKDARPLPHVVPWALPN